MKNLAKEWLRVTGRLLVYPFAFIAYCIAYAIGYVHAVIEYTIAERELDDSYEVFGKTYKL